MKKTIIALSIFLFSATCSANNSDLISIMKSCLYQKSLSEKIKYTIIKTDKNITDDNYLSLGKASYVDYKGHDIGYAENKPKRVIFYNKNVFPLDHAIPVDTGLPIKGEVKDIEYGLSEWAAISIKSDNYICVNLPFSGIGESGLHQYIRNIFVFKEKGKSLYYTVGDVSKGE